MFYFSFRRIRSICEWSGQGRIKHYAHSRRVEEATRKRTHPSLISKFASQSYFGLEFLLRIPGLEFLRARHFKKSYIVWPLRASTHVNPLLEVVNKCTRFINIAETQLTQRTTKISAMILVKLF